MNYSELFFGKSDITDLSYSDILSYFKDEKEESDKIEYKSFVVDEKDLGGIPAKEKGILRAICAFLNSEGGIIIWGAPKGALVAGAKGKTCKGELSLVEKKYDKDDFVAKIANRITPSPKGIKFHRIESENKYAYIFEVPKSEYSPHQFENVYYMRLDGQTATAPHHYIEALFKKITFPKLEGYINPVKIELHGSNVFLTFDSFIFNQSPLQNDYDLTYRIICNPGSFYGWQTGTNDRVSYGFNGSDKRIIAPVNVLHYGQPLNDTHTIVINAHQLQQEQNIVTILLSFGAKLSPLLMSSYKLKVPFRNPNNWKDIFIEMKENVYSHEIKGKSSVSNEESVQAIIGRKDWKKMFKQ
ncbi:MAG TPA: ATP-binding protein [Chitinophagales bacterium]|nr:ATP-binding protein [Chitinophagales bacterium]